MTAVNPQVANAGTTDVSPLLRMVQTTPTDYWNDSCSIEELTYGIAPRRGGRHHEPLDRPQRAQEGNGPLARAYLPSDRRESDMDRGRYPVAAHRGHGRPGRAAAAARVRALRRSKKGRLSIQTNPQNYRDDEAIADQAIYFGGLAPNMQVKIPVTRAGIAAIEGVTYAGVSVNATVSFTVPQMLAVAEAVERGLAAPRSRGAGHGPHGARLHHDDRPARRLDAGAGQARGYRHRSHLRLLGGHRGVQEGLRHFPDSERTAPARWLPPTGTSVTGQN